MKPFGKSLGIRLAFGAITILLGAIMAGQEWKNRQNESDSSWEVPSEKAGTLPAPIAAVDGEPWLTAPSTQPSEENPFPQSKSGVQLVQHLMPVDNAQPIQDATPADSDIVVPDMATPTFEIPDVQLPTFGEPSDSAPIAKGDGGGPAMEMQLPGSDEATAGTFATPTPNPINAAPPEPAGPSVLQSGPSLGMTNPEIVMQDTPAAPGDGPFAESNDSLRGNVLRGGADQGLRSQPEIAATPHVPSPASEAITDNPGSMLRALALPAQPSAQLENPQANAFVGNPQMTPAQNVAPNVGGPNDIQLRNNSNMRIVGGQQPTAPTLNPHMQNGAPAFNGAPLTEADQTDPRFNRSPSEYERVMDEGPRSQYGRASAPPLPPGQPSARIATLPSPTVPSKNYGRGYGSTMAQPASARFNVQSAATMASPGERRFEGVQSPSIVIQKRAPNEVKVGKPASFAIHVQNVGAVEAMDVRVHDQVPAGMRLVDASPKPVQQGDVLLWQLGSMRAGDERTVTMQLVPMEEGELGSVARVTFEAAASVRTISTRPELKILQNAPEKVLIGQQLEIELEVSNPGTGAAEGVVLQEDVPNGLVHPKGRQLDNALGTLRPGEVRRQVLRLRAVEPGVVQNTIRLKGDDGLEATHTVAVEVVSPQVQLALSGPSIRFLERQATFQLDIGNTGTADATNVEIAAYLDRGFTFVSTDFEGQYDPSRHAVFWSLASLPVGEQGKVPLTLLPVKEGERAIRLEAKADLGITAKNERTVRVDSLAELTFQINDSADPIEIGGETTYEIRLTNTGSRNDSNVRVQLQFPQGIELLVTDADAETDGRGLVTFAPRRELAAGGEVTYRVKARGVAPGTHIVKAVVVSDQSQVPVTKEESTMVYSDREVVFDQSRR